MTLALLHIDLKHNVWADSPSFPIQQIPDSYYDWNVKSNITGYQSSPEPVICDPTDFNAPSDIVGVNYYSDGSYLYATLWLDSPLEGDPPNNLTSREYGIQVDVKAVRDDLAADYASGIV
jgi:hypothetical protein